MNDLWGRPLKLGHIVTYPTNYRVTAIGVVVDVDQEPGGLVRIAPFAKCYGKTIRLNKSVENRSKHRKFRCNPVDAHVQILGHVGDPPSEECRWSQEDIRDFYSRVQLEVMRGGKTLLEVVKDGADRFDQRPPYRASVEARAELTSPSDGGACARGNE